MAGVNGFFQNNVEQKKQLKDYDSLAAPNHGYEYQVDLLVIGKKRDEDLDGKNATWFRNDRNLQ